MVASAAGTSTLANTLGERLLATVVRGDDFYRDMPEDQRWALNAEQGYACYFDWQRMRSKVLEPLKQGLPATYLPFDWATGAGLASTPIELKATDIVLVDGVYSARPELRDLYGPHCAGAHPRGGASRTPYRPRPRQRQMVATLGRRREALLRKPTAAGCVRPGAARELTSLHSRHRGVRLGGSAHGSTCEPAWHRAPDRDGWNCH